MNPWRRCLVLWSAIFLVTASSAQAQKIPRVGYIYPAGGRQGTTFEVEVGGRFLDGVDLAVVSGQGAQATVVKHIKPPTKKQTQELRKKSQKVWKHVQAANRKRGKRGKSMSFANAAEELGMSEAEVEALEEFRKRFNDPKRQPNPQLGEIVTLRVTLPADAQPGQRELRLRTAAGLSNPLRFYVGQLPESREVEPNDKTPDDRIGQSLPVIINGQIMPGDVDRFRFNARKGDRLVVAAAARELIPYLADAVPGWFQATLGLYDADGNELAYADDYQFHPDPVLYYEILEDGAYDLEIKDAIYRGREDFVYRITLGEVPFVTSVFPLGGRDGQQATVELSGWNLPADQLTLDAELQGPGIHQVSMHGESGALNRVPFAVDTLPECLDTEPNNQPQNAQPVTLPLTINGRIDQPGDWDVFRIEGRAGEQLVAEVQARRLNSPLDSLLELIDADGRQLAANDDHEDKGAGLTTHHADSRLSATLPSDGVYYLRLGDTQNQGGPAYAYRLRISPDRPDFALRIVPSSITARPGSTVPLTVHALRKDGFDQDIALQLKDPPPGYTLSGAWVPAGQDSVRLTLTVPWDAEGEPFELNLEGIATIDGQEVRRPAVAAEDMMQAFIYRHLVPSQGLVLAVSGRPMAPTRLLDETPIKLLAGSTTKVRFFLRNRQLANQLQLTLSEPPDGISIKNVSPTPQGIAVALHADAEKVKSGLKGNLLVEAFIKRAAKRKDGKPRGGKRRVPLGPLPAIPFEITAAATATDSDSTSPPPN